MRRKAFTLSELLVAMGLMVALLAGAGVVFHSAVQTQRASIALSEIMRKFRGITDQLDADFRGLRKDGEIVIVWVPDKDGNGGYDRLDRVMFFANGGFQTYNEQPKTPGPPLKRITGDLARVCYMLAKDGSGVFAKDQNKKEQRILSRTQHILTGDADLVVLPLLDALPLPGSLFNASLFRTHNFANEYDSSYGDLLSWKNNIDNDDKKDILSIITGTAWPPSGILDGGTVVDHGDPTTMHMLLCEGVGEFMVQGWGVDIDGNGIIAGSEARWFPAVDPDGDGNLSDSDFMNPTPTTINTNAFPALQFPGRVFWSAYPNVGLPVAEADFLIAPGLGRALKFTFTLYDSRGIYKNGKTFTHIIWLDK